MKSMKKLASAKAFITALGGKSNIINIDNCATRLRLTVKNSSKIKDEEVKKTGGIVVIKMSKTSVQIIVGPHVQQIATEMKKLI